MQNRFSIISILVFGLTKDLIPIIRFLVYLTIDLILSITSIRSILYETNDRRL